jgi:hypothetical protein
MEDKIKDHKMDDDIIKEAKKNPNGWVYAIDFKYLDGDRVPPEAIEGAWKVNANGEIEGPFTPNEQYRPIENSRRNLPEFMKAKHPSHAGHWIIEYDPRCLNLFPNIPKEAYVGYWLVGEDGTPTNSFRPTSTYAPDEIDKIIMRNKQA